jgi:hypothetical protein
MSPSMELVNTTDFFHDLRPLEQRRLYFLLLALRGAHPDDALAVAEQMERFIHGASAREQSAGQTSQTDADKATATSENTQQTDTDGTSDGTSRAKGILSDKVFRRRFENALASGANNREIAARFGLTLRQTNGLRQGLARRKTPPEPLRGDGGPQEAPRGQRQELTAESLDDVVRFLRQRDDVIVRNGENFLLNSRQLLTAAELVERANRKRRELGKAAFPVEPVERMTGRM